MSIHVRRVDEPPTPEDGYRVLIDRGRGRSYQLHMKVMI
jgi:uncharacterized protein YeaO (DUF488 family)